MRRYWTLLFVLAATWGASYLFIKVAIDGGLEPAPLMAARALIAGAVLFTYLAVTMGARPACAALLRAWRPCLVLGAVGAAIPFWLVGWGETHIDSGVAAIAQSTVPIFTLLLGWRLLPHEHVRAAQIVGVAVGLVGVGVLTGAHPEGGWWAVAGTLAVVAASFSFASGNVIGKLYVHDIRGPVLATGSIVAAAVYLVVPGVAQRPSEVPTTGAIAALLGLALLGTAMAQLIFYRALRLFGSHRVSLVTYLMPGFALVYGTVLLDEPVTTAALGGLALILLGVALGSGALRRRGSTSVERDDAIPL